MRLLITGSTGLLGSRVLPRLAGHEVLCLTRRPDAVPAHAGVCVIAGDLARPDTWSAQVQDFRPECCVHLAWEGLPDYSLDHCRANVDAGLRLFGVLAANGVQRIVVSGTCWEYGRASGAVQEEQAGVDCGIFASSKHALLTMLRAIAADAGFAFHWARVFFAYGPGQRAISLIPHLYDAYSSGHEPSVRQPTAVQDFIHVDDVADALVTLAMTDAASGVWNIGTGRPTSVGYVANRIAAHFGRAAQFADVADGAGFWADTQRMSALTGWRASVGIDEGIDRTLAVLDGAR